MAVYATPRDDDDDFQEMVYSGERKRAKISQPREPDLVTQCSICLAYWSNSGPHRIITIKCGHAFGEKCILDLIQSKHTNASCPICSEPIRKAHIRAIWPAKLFLHDDSGINELKQQLEQAQAALMEKTRLLEDVNIKYQQCRNQLHELSQDQSLQQEDLSQQQNTPSASSLDVVDASFTLVDTKALSQERHVTRVMTVVPEEEMVVTTMKQGQQKHGLYKLSLRDLRSCEFIGNHTAPVRDVKSSTKSIDNGNVTLLSTGFDKTLKLTSASNNCTLLSYTLPVVGWSCEFDSINGNQFYCGLGNNSILVFDIRNTKHHLQQLYDNKTAAVPLHSVLSCQFGIDHQPTTAAATTTRSSMLICASLTQTYQWKWNQDGQDPVCDVFQVQEKGFQPYSLAFDKKEQLLMVSSRASGSSSKQTIIQQSSSPRATTDGHEGMGNNWDVVWEYTSPLYQKTMTRTDLYEGVAYFSDDSGKVYSRNKDGELQIIPADRDEQILNIKSTHIQSRHYLISLTDNKLKLYNKHD